MRAALPRHHFVSGVPEQSGAISLPCERGRNISCIGVFSTSQGSSGRFLLRVEWWAEMCL